MQDNVPEHVNVKKDGYEVTLHPAFSSRCAIRSVDGAETELYKQKERHHLNGKGHPKKHTFRLKGGQHNRDLELEIKDPKYQVARIIVEFYAEGHEPGWGSARPEEPVEIMTFDNSVMTCPPYCGEDPG
ncbi:MAG TPA: hypothetical protein VGR37_21375 [Longimicrobiaceae bacterium]|nr:hypothetical protein [Longimicrobiaceae bacterium]